MELLTSEFKLLSKGGEEVQHRCEAVDTEAWRLCQVAISNLQRAERLLACIGNDSELLSELSNPCRRDWDPVYYPDWLLLEIENNILIRQVQAQIAREIISPSSGTNSILQLNMGEGKSSVIVPIIPFLVSGWTALGFSVSEGIPKMLFVHLMIRR